MTAATDRGAERVGRTHSHGQRGRLRWTARPGLLVVATLLVVAATGCGLSTNDQPEAIDEPQSEPIDTDAGAPDLSTVDGAETVKVWFLSTDDEGEVHLVEVERQVAQPATVRSLLEVLIAEPPDDEERDAGISTGIPESVTVAEEPDLRSDGVLTVELSEEFYDLQGETARNAFAQIVFTATGFTATGFPDIEMVQFERDGEPFSAVDGDGQSRAGPLSRASYRGLDG
jgi:spore germination protein GerM